MAFDRCDLIAVEPQDDGRVRLVIVAVDATAGEKAVKDFLVDATFDVVQAARNFVTALNTRQAKTASTLKPGPIDLTPPITEPPAKEDADRATFLAAFRLYQAEQRALAAGMPVTQTVAKDDLASLWKPEYVGLI